MELNWWERGLRIQAYTFYPERQEFISNNTRFIGWVCVVAQSGRFAYEVETTGLQTEKGEAEFGDLVFARPSGIFNRQVIEPPLVYHVLQWSFLEEDSTQNEVISYWQAGKWSVRDRGRLSSTLTELRPLLGRSDAWSTRRREHLLEDLLHLAWATSREPIVPDPLMSYAARLLRERAGENLAMSEISQALGIGAVQFTRRFYAAFGQNPIEHLTKIRLENAQKMLIETPATLDQIAARCGWASGAYLSFVFERHFSVTPGRFRKQHRV